MPYVPIARNLSSHGLQRRVGVPGINFRDHRLALLALSLLVLVTPRAGQGSSGYERRAP